MFFNSYIVAELLGRYLAIVERNEKKEFSEEDEILKDLFNLPFSEAIDFFLSKKPELYDKLDITTDNALDDYFWIKKSTDLEVTKKIQDKLLKTLEEGKTYSDFKKELDLENLGLGEDGHYWKGAFDMNMAFAQSRGQYEEQLEGIQYGFEYGLFDAILDGRETKTCHNLDGKVMLLTDWIEQGMYPPLHYRCRSRIIAITEEDVKDMGVTVEKKIEHAHVQKNFGKFSTREKDLKKICTKKEKEIEENKKKIDFSALNLVNKNSIEKNKKEDIIINEKMYPKKLAGVERSAQMNKEIANSGNVNPKFKLSKGYRRNCQTCVVVYEARLRGYDVEALEFTRNSMSEKLALKTNLAWKDSKTGKNPEYIFDKNITNYKKYFEYLKNILQKDQRYTMEFGVKGRRRVGHIVSIEKTENDKIHLYDPQTSRHYEEEEVLKYLTIVKFKSSSFGLKFNTPPRLLRVDNLEFDLDVVNQILKARDYNDDIE